MAKTETGKRKEKLGRKGKTVMREFASGQLRSSSGEVVTDQAQALAIAFSEQRNAHRSKDRVRSAKHRVRRVRSA